MHRVQCILSVTHQQIHFTSTHSFPFQGPSADCSQPISDNFGNFRRTTIFLYDDMIPVVAVETAESPEIVIWREIFRCNLPGFIELPKENARRDSES